MIGDTGVVIEADSVQLVLSTSELPPHPDLPEDWRGVFIEEARIHLPGIPVLPDDLVFRNCSIGSGGFTGEVSIAWPDEPPSVDLFGTTLTLTAVDLAFRQNALTESAIQGRMTLPFFDKRVAVEIGLDVDGGLNVELSDVVDQGDGRNEDGLLTLRKAGLLTLTVESVGFRVAEGELTVQLAGSIQPQVAGLNWPDFEVEEMTIHSDGRVDLDGGWLNLPEQLRLDFHGFSAELTRIGFGDTDDGYRWIGFSGGIQLVADLGLGATFEALRIEWPKDGAVDVDTIRLSLEGVGVDLTIPEVLAFKGTVRFINDTADPDPANHRKGFKGGVKLTLYSLNLEIDAEILVIRTGGMTAFYVYVNSDFPAGIPLASTGVALYGLGGLVGQNVAPNKTAEEAWYENWYKGKRLEGDPQEPGVASSAKWDPESGSMAFGAGVTVGTVSDNGFAVNGKLLLVLILPGPVILLEGRANLLTERSKLSGTAEPTFEALAVLDGRAGQFFLNVAAHYKKDSEGRIVDIRAGAEAFFDYHRADAWHLYLGQDEPRDKRIRAAVLSLFHADSYFMLTGRDLRFGFWVGFDESWRFGPLTAGLSAWIAADAAVSWKPVHVHGQLQLHGAFELSAFGVGLSVGVDARIAADAPTPYHVLADLHVELGLPWPLPDLEATVGLEWGEPHVPLPPTALPLGAASCEHLKASETWPLDRLPRWDDPAGPQGQGFWDGFDKSVTDEEEAAELAATYDEDRVGADEGPREFMGVPEVPLDVRPVLSFAKPVFDDVGFGSRREGAVEQVGDSAFEYHLVQVALHSKRRAAPDEPWEVVAVRAADRALESDRHRLAGTWQLANSGNDNLSNTRLMLWSKTSYDWTREQAGPMYGRWIRGHIADAFCPPPSPRIKRCVSWDDVKNGTRYTGQFSLNQLRFRLSVPTILLDVVHRPRAVFHRVRALRVPGAIAPAPPLLTITGFPRGTTAVSVSLDTSVPVLAQAYYGNSIKTSQHAQPGLITLTLKSAAIDQVVIQLGAQTQGIDTYLYRICYDAPLDPDRGHAHVEWANSIDETRQSWRSTDMLLEPDRYYRLTVMTTAIRNGAAVKREPFTEQIYFQTGQPPGIVAPPDDRNASDVANQHEHFPRRGPLKDLRPYIEYTVPAPEARAVYRAYDVGAYFNENYVDAMYQRAARPLKVFLYDASSDVVVGLRNEWGENPTLTLTHTEVQWLYSLDRATCIDSLDPHELPPDRHLNAWGASLLLRPETPYEARLVADATDGGDGRRHTVCTWRFITSRFAHFRHHIGSFREFLWDEHFLRHQPDTSLVGAEELSRIEVLATAERNGEAAPAGEPARFEEIAWLFGFGTEPLTGQPGRWLRPAPRCMDLTLLRDGTRRYGILLESPEPLDRERVSLLARYDAVIAEADRPRGSVKLLAAVQASAGDGVNEEYVDILVLQDQDVSNWRIEHSGGPDISGTPFELYYAFAANGEIAREGTLIRVHTGRESDDPAPEPTYSHHYAEQPDRVLNQAGDWVRVVNASGRIVHQRFFPPPWQDGDPDRDMVLIWNTDRTAAFVFFPDAGAEGATVGVVPDGRYRLLGTFKRTLTNGPVLKQERQSTDEIASLEFVVAAPR